MDEKKCVDVIIEKYKTTPPGAVILDDCPSDHGMHDKRTRGVECDGDCLGCWKDKAEELKK